MTAAISFLLSTLKLIGEATNKVTKEELGESVIHRTNKYLNNLIDQDHRGIKQKYKTMKGFKSFRAPVRFCEAFDELRDYYKLC